MTKRYEQHILTALFERQISRRNVLKGMGLGAAAAFLGGDVFAGIDASSSPLVGSDPQEVCTFTLPPETFVYTGKGAALFYGGNLIVNAGGENSSGFLIAFDSKTTQVRWMQKFPSYIYAMKVIGGTLFVADSDTLYRLRLDNGDMLWSKPYAITSDLTGSSDKVLFATANGSIRAVDLDGNELWAFSPGITSKLVCADIILSGGVVVAVMGQGDVLYAVDAQTGQFKWVRPFPELQNYGYVARLTAGGGNVYAAMPGYLYALNILTGVQSWEWNPPQADNTLSNPIYYAGNIHLGAMDDGSNFYAINAATGNLSWQAHLPGGIFGDITMEYGIAYFSVDGQLLAMDLATNGNTFVGYTWGDTPLAYGVESGVCFVTSGGTTQVAAVNMAGLLHQFVAESELLVEDYVQNGSTGAAQPNTTSYRSHIQILDPNKNPLPNKSIRILASAPVTITSGGTTYQIDSQNAAWLLTDGFGELSIVSSADTLTTPALYLWGHFMELGEAIVLYPDQDSLAQLSSTQGADLTGKQAVDYSGTPLLPASYTAQQAADLASTIRNTLGGGAGASLARTRMDQQLSVLEQKRQQRVGLRVPGPKGTASSYIAFPDTTTNLVYQASIGPTDRTYVPGPIGNWAAQFDANGGVVFTPTTPFMLARRQRKLTQKAKRRALGLQLTFSWSSLADFIKNVVEGEATVWTILYQNGIAYIKDSLGNLYQIVMTAIEDAITVVAGTLKGVIGDIKRALQWLSFIFDWSAILNTKNTLSTSVQNSLRGLKSMLGQEIGYGMKDVHQLFQTMETDVQDIKQEILGQLGSYTLQSRQQANNNPQRLYQMGGAKSYAKSRWLMQKFKDNASQASIGSSAVFASARSASLLSTIEDVTATVTKVMNDPNNSQYASIPQDVKGLYSNFSTLATNPGNFVLATFNDVVNILFGLIGTILQFTDAIVEGLLTALYDLIDTISDLVTQPIEIPVISDLYSWITNGSQLTLLDLFCLIIAVPTTIVAQALGIIDASASRQSLGDGPDLTANIGYMFALAFYAFLDAGMDLVDDIIPLQWAFFAVSLLVQGLSFPDQWSQNDAGTYIVYVAQFIPIVMIAVGILIPGAGAAAWETLSTYIYVFFGWIMMVTSFSIAVVENAFSNPSELLGLLQNIFGFMPYALDFLSEGGEIGKVAIAIVTGCCDLTTLGLAVAEWQE